MQGTPQVWDAVPRKRSTCWVSTAPYLAAVWSMVGHTVGLGDRHGENILVGLATASDARLGVGLTHRSPVCLEQHASRGACLPPGSCSQASAPGRSVHQPSDGPACHACGSPGPNKSAPCCPACSRPQIDCSNGDVVHVDFSCLFDKGLTLAKPEMVPFRCARASRHAACARRARGGSGGARRQLAPHGAVNHVDLSTLVPLGHTRPGALVPGPGLCRRRLTQNVIDGFGVSGVEGLYRRVCEITLGVLRAHRGSILRWAPATARPCIGREINAGAVSLTIRHQRATSQLTFLWRRKRITSLTPPVPTSLAACSHIDTFVHDPLVEWVRSGSNSGNGNGNGGSKSAAANDEGGDNPHAKDALATIEGAWVVMCCPGALAVISHTAATVSWAVCAPSTATKSVDVAPRLPLHTSK